LWYVVALWATRQTENTLENRELQIKVTLHELLVYIIFLVDICIGESVHFTLGNCLVAGYVVICTSYRQKFLKFHTLLDSVVAERNLDP